MRALVAHPAPAVVEGLAVALSAEHDLEVTTAITLADCTLAVAAHRPELAVVDLELAPGQAVALCDLLVKGEVRAVMVTHPGMATTPLALLEHGAVGIVVASDGLAGMLSGVRTVLQGHVHLPPHLLGSVLHDLIVERRRTEVVHGHRLDILSPREREVLALLGRGADTREIADRLVISPHTAKTHINRLLGKLGLGTRAEAAALAVEHDLRPSLQEVSHD